MKKVVIAIFILIFSMVFTVFSFGAVSLTIKTVNKRVSAVYDASSDVEITETITIEHKGDATEFFLTFSTGQSGDFQNRQMTDNKVADILLYQLYDSSVTKNILKDLSGVVDVDNILTGQFAASGTKQTDTVTYVYFIPADQFVSNGNYSDDVTVTLFEGNLVSWVEHDSQSVSYEVDMEEIAEISLVQSGQPFSPFQTELLFDFGLLESGENRGGDVIIRSNAVFTLSLKSDGKGEMTNVDRSDKSTVPYEFLFDGTIVNLTGNQAVDVAVSQGPTTNEGWRYPFIVTILPYGMATEGTYEDTITVTITTR